MTRSRAPKPDKGPIETAIDAQPTREGKRSIRLNLAFGVTHLITSFSRGDTIVTVHSVKKLSTGIRFLVSATQAGIPLDIDPIRGIHNPPNKIPTGTWHLETINGVEVEVENFIENSKAALESVLMDSVIEHPR